MPLTRLDNLISSKTGRYLYVSPDDFNASDALDNRGNSPTRPFLTIQRAFLEVARYSYAPKGVQNDPDNDRFDEFTILLSPGNHYIDNRPGEVSANSVPVFDFSNNEWNDSSILDLSNPDNILYKFNSVEGGAIIPRGTSLVGTDLRRTQVRPLYVPDPADKDVGRTSLFQVTGGCYFWQFTILDGDTTKNSPLYDTIENVGKVYPQPNSTQHAIPLYSHHKITNFVFARKEDLGLLYQKIARAFSAYQPEIDDPGEFSPRIQETRIVGPLTDSNQIESIKVNNVTVAGNSYVRVTVNTKVDHLFFVNQAVAVTNVGIREKLNGVFYVQSISTTNKKEFSYLVDGTAAGLGLVDNQTVTDPNLLNKPGAVAAVQAEVDSVESASPYVFNVSIRSTWGICGIWADGSRASGFKSMVIAQYTGVSLQKDDRAFIRYDELTNTWNQANLQDAFSTTPYHIDSAAYWKDDWRNFHVRASEDSFIQCVSIFAVGFADHFLMESGGDMSITNSNSNFGNTSLHTVGFKGFAFNQDKGGYVTDIIPPKKINASTPAQKAYYPFNIRLTKQIANPFRLYLNPPIADNPDVRPASSIDGNKIGATPGEKIYVKLDAIGSESGKQLKSSLVVPNGIKKWRANLSTLTPVSSGIDGRTQDAANLIDSNIEFIKEEAFRYILQKYPYLQDRPYVNPNITVETGRYRDASNLIKANRQEIIDTAFADMTAQFPTFTVPGNTQAGNQVNGAGTLKCKRDIGYIIDAVANDLYSGGNSNIVDATKAYFDGAGVLLTNGLAGETQQSIYAFERAREYMKQALTNQLTIKDNTISADPATGSNTNPNSCANVRSTVDTLISIINTALNPANPSLGSLPSRNPGPWSIVAETSKCKRDIGYIVEAITSDLRVGGNQNVVNAAQAYYVGMNLDYIENEKTETLDAYQYVRDLAIAAMRNWSFVRQNCVTSTASGTTTIGGVQYPTASIVNVGSTLGILVGMRVTGTGMPTSGAFVKKVVSATQIQLGTIDSRLDLGNSINASSTQTNTTLTFTLEKGAWATSTVPLVDSSIVVDTTYPECANVASAIDTYYQIINTIISTPNGINNITINVGTIVNNEALSKRGTLFKLTEAGTSNNNPHRLETGTPVKLVPKALNDSVDKRVVRLPKGFDTNTKYYVIAPGRFTQPHDYSSGANAPFSGTNEQVIMLAASLENANAGIYIYSPETDTVDPNVVIEVNQYVKDVNYDLMKYKTSMINNTTFQTEGPHSFDLPLNSLVDDEEGMPQKVFFRIGTDITGSALPELATGGTLSNELEYYVRYIKPSLADSPTTYNTRFTIHTTLTGAKNGTGAVEFVPGHQPSFYVYANKRRAPLKFDPTLSPKPVPVVISTVTRASNTATIVTTTPHGLNSGDIANVVCSNATFNNSNAVVTLVNSTTFTYFNTGSNLSTTSATGSVTKFTSVTTNTAGCWYLKVSGTDNQIYERFVLINPTVSSDTYFTRIEDDREISDKVYRLRYVIPKNGNYREPINGFVLKVRTDDTRRLLPQKILLKPQTAGAPSFGYVATSDGERLGLTTSELTSVSTYDPYVSPKELTTNSKINFKIQSARKVKQGTSDFLELTVFDIGIKENELKTKIFTTIKLSNPQGGNGNFSASATLAGSSSSTMISWNGYSSGTAYVHAWFPSTNQLILRSDAPLDLKFSAFSPTTFTQGTGTNTKTAILQESPDGGRSDKSKFLYSTDGASVYTMTPGDLINLPLQPSGSADYVIASVEDVEDIENTYYIFKSEVIKRRVKGQQDGIYYLTCLRGDIRPYPTGSGIGENFRNFKFSQPVSRVYPQNYKNDPLWFQINDSALAANPNNPSRDNTIQDPPETVSAADNYIHGYVTVNDARSSVTKESILDLVKDPGLGMNIYSGTNTITAQEGGASAGSESRKISISGNSPYPTQKRLYVELRRPSIARSGNHTFEYLGFGPGNYSTSFPSRQQIVLTDKEDFYAQAKKEDAGIVLYTGLNSSGDLYIGNRKINAITGEETFLDAPILDDEDEEVSLIGSLVTTFDDPVTFNNTVSFLKPPVLGEYSVTFTTPVLINSPAVDSSDRVLEAAFAIENITAPETHPNNDPYKNGLDRYMLFWNNVAQFGVWKISARGIQEYSIRTSNNNVLPPSPGGMIDVTGNTLSNFAPSGGQNQFLSWGSTPPKSGDILFKGDRVGYSGSLGIVNANDLELLEVTSNDNSHPILSIQTYLGYAIVKITFRNPVSQYNISSQSQFRFKNATNPFLNDYNWSVQTSVSISASSNGGTPINYTSFNSSFNYVFIKINQVQQSGEIVTGTSIGELYHVKNIWKEFGVVGSEALRTNTDKWGDFKLGVNTLARSAHSGFINSFVNSQTTPRANLDVVGTTFISGKTIRSFLTNTGTTKTETTENNAFLVGGNSASPDNEATLRVATTNNGRVGINITNAELDRALVVDGTARITGDFKFENDIDIDGGGTTNTADVRTAITTGSFNLLSNTGFIGTLNVGGFARTINIGDSNTTATQLVDIGTLSTGTTTFNLHTASTNSTINVGTVNNTSNTAKSFITIGGAKANPQESILTIKNAQTTLGGSLNVDGGLLSSTSSTFSIFPNNVNTLNIGGSAGVVNIGGLSGTTTISTALRVLGTTTLESDVIQNGGFRNSNIGIQRDIFGNVTIASVSRNGSNVATITTVQTSPFGASGSTRSNVVIRCSDPTFNTVIPVTITVTGTNTFTYSNTGPSQSTVTATGVISDGIGSSQSTGTITNRNIDYYSVNENVATILQISAVQSNKLIVANHYFSENDQIKFVDVGNLTGVTVNTLYYVLSQDTAGFTLSSTQGGNVVTISLSTGATDPGRARVILYSTTIDTEGDVYWPNDSFKYLVNGVWDGLTWNLPVNNPNGIGSTGIGELYLLGTEIVKIVSLPSSIRPYVVRVQRAQDGTTDVAHPDGERLYKLAKQQNATYISPSPITATNTSLNIAEFSGTLRENDILRLNAGTGTDEFVRISAINPSDAQSFVINNGDFGTSINSQDPLKMFRVISTTGNTQIIGDVTIGFDSTNSSASEDTQNDLNLADRLGFSSSTSTGSLLTQTGGGNLKVHNSIELSGNSTTTTPGKQYFVVTNGSTPKLYVESASGNTKLYGGANLQIMKDAFFASGNFDKSREDGSTNVAFEVLGSTGNTKVGGTLRAGNDLSVGTLGNSSLSETSTNLFTTRFTVDAQTGNTSTYGRLTINTDETAQSGTVDSTPIFSINNLGPSQATNRPFVIKNDASIDAFGNTDFYNRNGGRKTIFISQQGNTDATAIQLKPNLQYITRCASTLILKLPGSGGAGDVSPVTGDTIRIVDAGGALNFAINLVIRAAAGTRLQNSSVGSTLGGLASSYGGGELIVNTPNAAFGLIYVGNTDSDGNGVPSDQQGWYLMEI